MKNLVLGILLLGLTSVVYGQQKLVAHNKGRLLLNEAYLDKVSMGIQSSIIHDLETLVASYDIKKATVYVAGIATTYSVRIGNGNNEITAVYDESGALLSTEEQYKDIVLPLSVRISIAKAYPGWTFITNAYTLKYAVNEAVERTCTIGLKKENEQIQLSLNLSPLKFLEQDDSLVANIN